MIDPTDPPDIQIAKLIRIIEALINRSERGHQVGGTAYSLFQSAIALQSAVWEKTKDLEKALDTLGEASTQLEIAHQAQDRMQKNLADAMVAMEGGFALFSDNRLQVCNTMFRTLLPDVAPLIQPGLDYDAYLAAVNASKYLSHEADGAGVAGMAPTRMAGARFSSFVMALKNDRWFQVSYRQTRSDNIAILQTEITDIVRENRLEKTRLIDQHTHFLHAAFDHMTLGICTFSPDGELLVRNQRFAELLGVPLPLLKKGTGFQRIVEFIQRNEVLDGKSNPKDFSGWVKALLRGEPVQERFRRSDGMSLDLRIHLLPDNGFIVSIMDTTAETAAADARLRVNATLERRVKERTAELTEANRLLQIQSAEQAHTQDALRLAKEAAEAAHASKTRFLAAASHDLLQPINAGKLYISTLKETVGQSAARETVERLDRSFASIESLLHALLDISRLDSSGAKFCVTTFCLESLLQTLSDDLAPVAAEKGLALRIVPSTRWVTSDPHYLLRCVQNLAMNAIQYTECGRVVIGCRVQGKRLRIEVRDTGIGISAEDQSRIFNEFTRVGGPGSGNGMGLGLSIVDRACRQLGHPVHLVSQPGHGSMFSIELPLATRARASLSQSQPETSVPEGSLDLIVLIVENDPDVLHAMTQKLESWGASVLAAPSTATAAALMRDIGTAPDILLVDYQLDDGDSGVETIRSLRATAGTRIPAIMLTADRSKGLVRLGAELSFTVLTKPVPLARLRALIDWETRRPVK